ncbi:HPP family protein [Azospirillum sp. INR13]|uniref:HPP family protein n=1 Tax=Azospirillum sp. INR13 TaxID=2596919 RepID=UPI00210254D6|nr:hypothetical protein [Azospirillum sp. INR13]
MTRGKLAALRDRLAGWGEFVFRPILPGATLRDRMIACCGALLGIAATGLLCRNMLTYMSSAPVLVAPMGASAVLLFAVPASPLAQPGRSSAATRCRPSSGCWSPPSSPTRCWREPPRWRWPSPPCR